MAPKYTRRQLAAALPASAALLAQTPAPLPKDPEEELKAVRGQVQQNGQALAKFEIPMATEPAAHFKA